MRTATEAEYESVCCRAAVMKFHRSSKSSITTAKKRNIIAIIVCAGLPAILDLKEFMTSWFNGSPKKSCSVSVCTVPQKLTCAELSVLFVKVLSGAKRYTAVVPVATREIESGSQ